MQISRRILKVVRLLETRMTFDHPYSFIHCFIPSFNTYGKDNVHLAYGLLDDEQINIPFF